MDRLSKIFTGIAVAVFCFCVADVLAVTINEVKFKTGSLQHSAQKIRMELERGLISPLQNNGNQYDFDESLIRAQDFAEEVAVYDKFLSNYQRANNILLLQAYTERLNDSFFKLNRILQRVNFYPVSFVKSEGILKDINNLVVAPSLQNNNVSFNTNIGVVANSNAQPSQMAKNSQGILALGLRSANSDKRIQWMVGSTVKSVTIECFDGQAIVDTLFIDGEIRKSITRTLKPGDKIQHISNGKNNIRRIVMPVRKVKGNFQVQCLVEK